jgi:putative membrane protein
VIITTASTAPCRREFQNDRIVQALLGCYVIVWIVLAVSPVDRKDWLLENLLAMTLGLALVATYRTFAFSDLSYILITVFMTLHAIGAHYTYSKVPLGFWLKDAFDLSRNHFDRIVHFAFGLLLAYPIRELLLRTAHVRGFWSYYLPISATLALSGLFEVIESWVAQIVSPELGDAYLGTQGDVWDAQKDMTAAFIGALIAILLTLTIPKIPPPRLNPPAQ